MTPTPRSPLGLLAPVLVAIAVLAAYSNTGPNAFALDDWHTIQQNPRVRSLRNIPDYFRDPRTFSVLPRNVDYRPVLQTTYALNYALSQAIHGDGYDPRTWHWLNMVLHGIVAWSLFLLGRRLIGTGGLSRLSGVPPAQGDAIALAAALLFAVHPVTSGCVNYMSARSSLLVTAFALPALVLYLRAIAGSPLALIPAFLLYVLALFSKIEAAALMGVLLAGEFLLSPALREIPLWRRPLHAPSWRRAAPFIIVTVAYVLIWRRVSPLKDSPGLSIDKMGSGVYLLTQVRAWWYYIAEILAPIHLVADEAAYPVSGGVADAAMLAAGEPLYSVRRALLDPRVWLALAGWGLVFAACLRVARRAPLIPFLVAAFLMLLSPTSSLVPLAEMVNEHRPYFPIAGLFILVAVRLWLLIRAARSRHPRTTFAVVCIVLAIPLLALTRQRNTVWATDLSLWKDTAQKSPDSARAQMNYGLALMRLGQYNEAEARFRRSLAIAPFYHYAHTNLAIVLASKGDFTGAAASHDQAVQSDPTDAGPYYWRGRFRASRGDLSGAIADFQTSVKLNPSAFTEAAALAEALSRAGRTAEADAIAARYGAVDPAGFAAERKSAAALFPKSESSVALNDRAVALMGQSKYPEALALLSEALRVDPANHLAYSNLGVIRAVQGDNAGAMAAHNDAVRVAPNDPSPYYWRARQFIRMSDLPHAIEDLQAAAQRSGQNIHETGPLVECFSRAGRAAEAEALLAKARESGNADAMDKERAAFRAAVFGGH